MTTPRLMTVLQCAAYINVSERTLRNHGDLIPGRKRLGRRVLYDRVLIDRWISENNGLTDLLLDASRITGTV